MRKQFKSLASLITGASLQSKEMITPQVATTKEIGKDKRRRRETLEETTSKNGTSFYRGAYPQPIFIPTKSQQIKSKRLKKKSNK